MTVVNDVQAVYLAQRSAYPMKGIWCFGGRMFFNDDTPEDSVSRCVETETSVRLRVERFECIATNLYSWHRTAQGNFPGKNFAPLYKAEVTTEELDQMRRGLRSSEYDKGFGIQRFCRERLIDENVHPAMVDAFDLIWSS